MTAAQKYPGAYFQHFISMLSVNYSDKKGRIELSEENVNDLILLYVHIEGEEEFRKLQAEVKEIVANKDIVLFTKKELKKAADVEFVAKIILKHH